MAGENNIKVLKDIAASDLNEDIKDEAIKKLVSNSEESEGVMDKIFGKKNPQMYVTLLMSLIVLVIVAVFTMVFRNNLDFVKFIWNVAVPAVTLLWGYAFGKSQND